MFACYNFLFDFVVVFDIVIGSTFLLFLSSKLFSWIVHRKYLLVYVKRKLPLMKYQKQIYVKKKLKTSKNLSNHVRRWLELWANQAWQIIICLFLSPQYEIDKAPEKYHAILGAIDLPDMCDCLFPLYFQLIVERDVKIKIQHPVKKWSHSSWCCLVVYSACGFSLAIESALFYRLLLART